MKKLLFITLLLTSSLLPASIHLAYSNPLPSAPRLAQKDLTDNLPTPQQVQQAAKSITVRITSDSNGGSGVIIAKKGDSYLILTNAHVVKRANSIAIQAPDGQKYQAKSINGGFNSKYDLALLQFTSKTKYTLANLKGIAGTPIEPTRKIYSSGFPFDSKEIRITSGEVSQLTDIPFDDGTQIGYVTNKGEKGIRQGMSGGAMVDSQGLFIGINTLSIAPISPNYTYSDGSKPIPKLAAQYTRANWGIPVYNFLSNVKADILYGYDNLPKVLHQTTPTGYMAKLNDTARKKTVRIENSDGSGSGVIVAKEGNSYYVLTAKHVVQDEKKNTHQKFTDAQIITYDQESHPVTSTVVAEGVDLAVIKFTSKNNYPMAKLGQYSTKDDDLAFVGGFPDRLAIKSPLWQWQLNPGYIFSKETGKLRTQNDQSFGNGYDLIYGSISYGGMSGGPVFDTAGNVIGIHGRGESADLNSVGMSIQTFIGLAKANKLQIAPNLLKIDRNHPSNLSAVDRGNVIAAMQNLTQPQESDPGKLWLDYGNQLYRTRQNDKSIVAFDKAISKNKALALAANYGKALSFHRAKKFDSATAAIAQAISAAPIDRVGRIPNYYLWNWQSVILRKRYKYDEAIRSIDIAIDLKPDDLNLRHEKVAILMNQGRNEAGIAISSEIIRIKPEWYYYLIRASMKLTLGDAKGALEDQNIGIKLNPEHENLYVARAWIKMQMGDKRGAIEDVNRAIRLNPNSDHAISMLARFKSDAGDNEGAMKDINLAIQIDPENVYAYSLRADIKDNLKNYDGAIEDLNRAIQIDPYYVNAYVDRCRSKSNRGDKQGAIADCTQALEIDPNFYLAYTFRIIVKAEIGDNKGVIEDSTKALKLKSKDDNNYYFFRAHAKSELGDNKGAIEDYNKAIELRPKKAYLYSLRGSAKLKLGDKQGAIADFDRAIKIDPKDASEYFRRGNIKNELGDKQGAINDLTKAIELEPKDATYRAIRGNIKFKYGDKQGALLDLNKAIELNPTYSLAYSLRGDIKLGLEDKQGAIADYTQAIKINPKNDYCHYSRGNIKQGLGDRQGAIVDYTQAIQINPKNENYYISRSIAKFELGDNLGAIKDTNIVIMLNPKSALAYANRGAFLIIDGKEKEALPDLERSIKLDPKISYAYAGRGIVRETLGDKRGAISDYKQAVKLNPQIIIEWKKQSELLGKYNLASYRKYQQMIQKLEAGIKLN